MWNRKLTVEVVYEGGEDMTTKSITPILKKIEKELEDEAF